MKETSDDENAHLINDYVPLHYSSSFKANANPASQRDETPAEHRRRLLCISITCAGTFLTFLQESIYWVSLWPYISQIDPSAPESFFGFIVSAFACGSMFSGPLLGWWSNRIKSTKWPIMIGFVFDFAGSMLMAFVEAFPVRSRRWIMLLARFVSGIGAGNDGVSQAYLVHSSTLEERNLVLSVNAAMMSCATMLGAGFGAALTPIGYPGVVFGNLHIDMYTSGAFLCAFAAAVLFFLNAIFYKEHQTSIQTDDSQPEVNDDGHCRMIPLDKLAIFCCILLRFTVFFCAAYDDTVSAALSMAMFNWTGQQAVLYVGIIQVFSGVVNFVGNIFLGVILLKYVKETTAILIGLICLMMFYLVSFSWPGLPELDSTYHAYQELYDGHADQLSLGNSTTSLTTNGAMGCYYKWCEYTTRIYEAQFVVAFAFLALAFVFALTPTTTLFSKVLGPIRQGTWQGIFSSSMDVAALTSPILVSSIFDYFGPRAAWGLGIALILIVIVFFGFCWKRLVPRIGMPTQFIGNRSVEISQILSSSRFSRSSRRNVPFSLH